MKRFFASISLLLCLCLSLCILSCTKKEEPYRDSGFVGEWKANSIERREENMITYRTLSIVFAADGSCSYNGESASWTPDEENGKITVTPKNSAESISLIISRDDGSITLKYRTDTYYKASEFVPKDSESVSASTAAPNGSSDPDQPEPVF